MLTRTVLALTLFSLATPGTAEAATEEGGWITVAPLDLATTGLGGVAGLKVTLGGAPPRGTEVVVAPGSTRSLDELAISLPFDGVAEGVNLSVELTWNEIEVLRMEGVVRESAGGFALVVRLAESAPSAALRFSGRDALLLEKGWHDDRLTVGFAWHAEPDGDVEVELSASVADGINVERAPATRRADGAWSATFDLTRLPATLDWNATILEGGEPRGVTGSRVTFPTLVARGGFFEPAPGSGLATAGGFHDVEAYTRRVAVPASAFGPTFDSTDSCEDRAVYDTLLGETWRILSLVTRGQACSTKDGSEASQSQGPGDPLDPAKREPRPSGTPGATATATGSPGEIEAARPEESRNSPASTPAVALLGLAAAAVLGRKARR